MSKKLGYKLEVSRNAFPNKSVRAFIDEEDYKNSSKEELGKAISQIIHALNIKIGFE